MAILIVITDRDASPLRESLQQLLPPEVPAWLYPEVPDPKQVKMLIVWKQPVGIFQQFPNLKLISSLGAGVEHVLNDPELPSDVSIVRMVDEQLVTSMRDYVLMAVLNIQKQLRFFQQNQASSRWQKPEQVNLPIRVGMLGIGALGGHIAQFLAAMGFEVWGYSQSEKSIDGVRCLSGEEVPVTAFASQVNVLVCLLPNTPETANMLDRTLFEAMPRCSHLVNVGRGAQLAEEDLLWALDEGIIDSAWLDVFKQEPLPEDHAFWQHPKIVITPHIASVTDFRSAAGVFAENYRRCLAGEPLLYAVDRDMGY